MAIYKRKRSDGTPSPVYSYYFRHKGRRYSGSTEETTKGRAQAVEAQRRIEVRKGRASVVRDCTFEHLCTEYLRLHAAKKKSSAFYEATVAVLRRHFGKTPLSQIGPKEVEEFMVERRAAVKSSTANRSLTVLKQMFGKAVEWGNAASDPAARFKLEKEPRGREFFLTEAQQRALLAAVEGWLRPLVLVALHTGARRGELLGLTWEDVDLVRRLVTFRGTKNGEDRTVKLSKTAAETLRELPSRFPARGVFRGPQGDPLPTGKTPAAFHRAVKAAKLDGFRFHDLRHSAASFMVQRGVPLNTVRQVLGHKSLEMTLRYSHLAPDHLEAAAQAMDQVHSTPTDRAAVGD